MRFIFCNYVECIRKCYKDPSTSLDEVIRNLFSILYEDFCCGIDVDPSDATHIMNREAEIFRDVRKKLKTGNLKLWIENTKKFINESIDEYKLERFKVDIVKLIDEDVLLDECIKNKTKDIDKESNVEFICNSLIEVLKNDNRIIDKHYKLWSVGQNSLNLYYGDLLKLAFNSKHKDENKIVVIPVNTNFDVEVSNDSKYAVSPETVHGKWILAMKDNGVSPTRIKNVIKKYNPDKNEYGKIIPYKFKNTTFYLLAITEFIDGVATTTMEKLQFCVEKLMDYYNQNGQGQQLYVPLMGTGRSRLGMSNLESFKFIKETIMENTQMIQGNVNILVYYKNAEDIEEEKLW